MLRLYRRPKGEHGYENCYYIETGRDLNPIEVAKLRRLVAGSAEPIEVAGRSFLDGKTVTEIGPRLAFETAHSSNAVAICVAAGIGGVVRIERSARFSREEHGSVNFDRMTEMRYIEPLTTFAPDHVSEEEIVIDVLNKGHDALIGANKRFGWGMDGADIDYYVALFLRLGRNPTVVECYQLGNANSEHSRHHFFRGIQEIDGVEMRLSLMDIVKEPWKRSPGPSITAFHDNAGVAEGAQVMRLVPVFPGEPSHFRVLPVVVHFTATAETHNHPTMIAPFPGAETGVGGRIRDSRAVGRGSLEHVGFAGYGVGNLYIPGYYIPGEDIPLLDDGRYASALDVLISGSNGVSDYGNKIGEPLIGGFCRSFCQVVGGVRYEFRKPVLYSAGLGLIDKRHVRKHEAQIGMLIVQIGGPIHPLGVGGGAASSMGPGANTAELDLKSVQRGDPETENRVNRVIQGCVEMGDTNPIEAIHDQGAGGAGNVITELVDPKGGEVDLAKFVLGDKTMKQSDIWVAEAQERYGLLVRPENLGVLLALCERERVNCEVLGVITGDEKIVVRDSRDGSTPVDLPLKDVLSDMPQKRFASKRILVKHEPLRIPEGLTIPDALQMVLKRVEVGSKGYLSRKVDRSVGGLVARQQCAGPMQVPVADAGVMAASFYGTFGAAAALGEQPIVSLIDPAAGARMAVLEMFTNIASAGVSICDVSCRANWMWAAKLPGEGARLYDAARAMADIMIEMGTRIHGGKDSLSLAVQIADQTIVSPGQLVIMGSAPVADIGKVVTPDFKGGGMIGFVDLGRGKNRLGGSSLAQALGQLGDEPPDVEDPRSAKRALFAITDLIREGLITAYHDRSDGGLITALVEMCIAGNRGARVVLPSKKNLFAQLFSQEGGFLFEYAPHNHERVRQAFASRHVEFTVLGKTQRTGKHQLSIMAGGRAVFRQSVVALRRWWESTSTQIELRQAIPMTVREEEKSFGDGKEPKYRLTYVPELRDNDANRPKVAVIREEGVNGDREMVAALTFAGLDPKDVSMNDIRQGKAASLDEFRGVIFPGGFSFADTFGSAVGWAAGVREAGEMFDSFFKRVDTFSLGVCNGCQLMVQLGLVPGPDVSETSRPRLLQNRSGRFESRWSTVHIRRSPSILLRGMEGSTVGVWVAHGEGRFEIPDPQVAEEIRFSELAPIRYVDQDGTSTERYPYNPNGSVEGIAALCSRDGRHLAMMPHPERAFLPWQCPWNPPQWRDHKAGPWLQMFQNARDWCLGI